MKRLGIIGAVALTLLISGVKVARAQVIIDKNVNTDYSDSEICPNGCMATTITAVYPDSNTTFTGTVYTDSTGYAVYQPGGYTATDLMLLTAAIENNVVPSTSGFQSGGAGVSVAIERTLGVPYGGGQRAGFYQWSPGSEKYFPIQTGIKEGM